jgi:hypothetical protein
MHHKIHWHIFIIASVLYSGAVFAADFDGSKPLLCAPSSYTECTTMGCERVDAAAIRAPRFLQIDAKRKRIEPVGGGAGRTSKIDHVERVDGKLIVQGVEDGVEDVRDGLGYSIAISETTGDMVLSAAGDGVSFTAFGACILERR